MEKKSIKVKEALVMVPCHFIANLIIKLSFLQDPNVGILSEKLIESPELNLLSSRLAAQHRLP